LEVVTYVTALLAGVVSIMSPCVLPLLPGVVAYSTEKNKLVPLAIVLGLTASFTAMGIASAIFGSFLMDYIDYLKLASGILILFMGLYILSRTVEDIVLRVWQFLPLSRISHPGAMGIDETSLFGGVVLGASLGIVWIPCIGPILASILMLVAQDGGVLYGASLLITYSMGLAVPMLIIAYSSNLVTRKLKAVAKYALYIRKIAGVILVLAGLYFLVQSGFLPSVF
jgi:cytochrome c-type biogenesis protein